MKILLIDNGLPFDINTIYEQPLGGSEATILLLAKGLADLDHEVVLLNNNSEYQSKGTLIKDNVSALSKYYPDFDTIILNRCFINEMISNVHGKKIIYMSHDAYDQQVVRWMMNRDANSYFHKVICVSEWQKHTFEQYFKISSDKLEVLGNPIDPYLYMGNAERDLNKLIFASIPYKGLEVLPDLFNEIKIKSKNDKLHLDVFSSMGLYNRPEEDEQYQQIFTKLLNTKDIKLNNPISMNILAYNFKKANIYLSPSLYHETFGRVFVESLAGGCWPVAVNNGANKEVLGGYGTLIDYPNIKNIDAFNAFVDKTCATLELSKEDHFNTLRSNAEEYALKKWNYKTLSEKLLSII